MQNLNFFVHGCMSTRHSSGNDLGKDSCDVLRRYDNVCVTEIKQIFCVCLSYYSFYISTVCWSSNTKCLFTQKLYVTLHPCPIFLPCDMFFPSCSRSSCWAFYFHSHIWNLLWLLFILIACSSVFWVAETNISVINIMAIWCIIVIICFKLSKISVNTLEYFVEWNAHWPFPEPVEQFHTWQPIYLMAVLMLALETFVRAFQLRTWRQPYCYSWCLYLADSCNIPEATCVYHPQRCWCNNWFHFGLPWRCRAELGILWID